MVETPPQQPKSQAVFEATASDNSKDIKNLLERTAKLEASHISLNQRTAGIEDELSHAEEEFQSDVEAMKLQVKALEEDILEAAEMFKAIIRELSKTARKPDLNKVQKEIDELHPEYKATRIMVEKITKTLLEKELNSN